MTTTVPDLAAAGTTKSKRSMRRATSMTMQTREQKWQLQPKLLTLLLLVANRQTQISSLCDAA